MTARFALTQSLADLLTLALAAGGMSLGGFNTYVGTTTISAGIVQAQSSFGNAANQLVLDGGGIVSAGALLVNGDQSAATGSLSVLSGATLGGSGIHGGTMSLASGSTLSPGNSPGTITSASGSWAGSANSNVQIVDAAGTAGTDWDLANFTGALHITATSGMLFLVNLWTLASTGPDVDGNAGNFSSNSSYAWKIASTAGGVTNFAVNKFTVNTSATSGQAGTLEVTGSITSSAVSVAAGATLSGDGPVGQTVTAANSGTLSPGSGSGTGILDLGGLSLGAAVRSGSRHSESPALPHVASIVPVCSSPQAKHSDRRFAVSNWSFDPLWCRNFSPLSGVNRCSRCIASHASHPVSATFFPTRGVVQ